MDGPGECNVYMDRGGSLALRRSTGNSLFDPIGTCNMLIPKHSSPATRLYVLCLSEHCLSQPGRKKPKKSDGGALFVA